MHLAADTELILPVEKSAGLNRAVNAYAVLESAFRYRRGLGVAESRDRIAALYARFSQIAADNPDAWRPRVTDAPAIRDPSPSNPMMAFPYARHGHSVARLRSPGEVVLLGGAWAPLLDQAGDVRSDWVGERRHDHCHPRGQVVHRSRRHGDAGHVQQVDEGRVAPEARVDPERVGGHVGQRRVLGHRRHEQASRPASSSRASTASSSRWARSETSACAGMVRAALTIE